MSDEARNEKRPQAYCHFCSTKTPHLYERLAVNGRLMARAICLSCNNERPREAGAQTC
jgi:hypothetical protein